MTRRRWIADEYSGTRAALVGEHAAHLARTLRARQGQEFDVACGERLHRAVTTMVSEERVEFELCEEIAARRVTPITLMLAIFKFDRMEWTIEKCTELNVTKIVPVVARRTEKHLAQAADKRAERWRRIAREAAQQSRRLSAPEVAAPVLLSLALNTPADLRVALAETERLMSLAELLRSQEDFGSVALAIGPEGGWVDEELRAFGDAGWESTSLGDTILRAETAAIAALAIARSEIG